MVIARPETENSILEIVAAWSQQKRVYKLVVLGRYTPHSNQYHAQVMAAASDEVEFIGGVYDQAIVYSRFNIARIFS